jgi:NadR type nicotinamide-nucleotide adenylyltransferase
MTRRGFLLGKFLPPHEGHRFLVNTALGMTDEVTVLVCSNNADPVPGALRWQWARAMLPRANVVHLHRNLPQEPKDHPDFWAIWRNAIHETCGSSFTHVFGSEPYVFRLAQELRAAPVIVDPDREAFPVSGRAILAAPHRHWRFVPPDVRPYFQKRVTMLGPESTGKSRLAAELAERFATLVMPEYGRAFDVHYKHARDWTAEDFVRLAETHAAMRQAMAGRAGPLLVEDTDAVQTAVWSQHLVGTVAHDLEAIERASPADHYLLLAPDVAWVQDGVRYAGSDAVRRFFFEDAERRLQRLGVRYDVIAGGDWGARARAAHAAIVRRIPELEELQAQ